STFFAISHIDIKESQSSPSRRLFWIACLAFRDSRRSSVNHHSQACVSRSVSIPGFVRSEWIADFLEHAPGKPLARRAHHTRDELGHGPTALGDDDGHFGPRHIVQRFQAYVLELASSHRFHINDLAIAIWPCQSFR